MAGSPVDGCCAVPAHLEILKKMKSEIRKHRSTANTARLISSIILISAFFIFAGGIVMLAIALTPEAKVAATDLTPESFKPWININYVQSALLLGGSILFAWMGYSLRVLACILETQLPDKVPEKQNVAT